MSEGGVMNCGEFSDMAAELALGVLTGRERADALAHLESCEACREMVRQFAVTGEGLVQLLPAVEPPPGFETQVMARIGIATAAPAAPAAPAAGRRTWRLWPRFGRARAQVGRPRRMLAAAAAALAIVAAGLGGWGIGTAGSTGATTALSSAALVSAHHQNAGKIFFYKSNQPWIYMSVDLPAGDGAVTCQVAGPDGHFMTVGTFRLDSGYGAWGGPSPLPSGMVTGARIVGHGGAVLATAHF